MAEGIEDLDELERALGITLPKQYREIMARYPFSGSNDLNCQLERSLRHVLDSNKAFRRGGFGGVSWPESRFTFGHDGAGNHFFLELSRQDDTVYCIDHETHEISVEAPDLTAWVDQWK